MGDEKLGAPGQLVVTGQADLVQPLGKMLVRMEMIMIYGDDYDDCGDYGDNYDDGSDYDDHDNYDGDDDDCIDGDGGVPPAV